MDPLHHISPAARRYMGLKAEAQPGTPPATPAPPADPPARTDPPPADPPAAGNGNGDGRDEDFDRARAMATIQRQRESEAAAKKEAAEARAEAERLRQAQLTEEQRKEEDRRAAEARAAAAEDRANRAELLGKLAARDDVADAELARDALLAQGIEFDDDGSPKDFDAKVERLLEAKPVLRKGEAPAPGDGRDDAGREGGQGAAPAGTTPPPPTNAGAGNGGQGSPPQLTADQVKAANEAGMTLEQYASLKREKVSLSDWQESRPRTE